MGARVFTCGTLDLHMSDGITCLHVEPQIYTITILSSSPGRGDNFYFISPTTRVYQVVHSLCARLKMCPLMVKVVRHMEEIQIVCLCVKLVANQ